MMDQVLRLLSEHRQVYRFVFSLFQCLVAESAGLNVGGGPKVQDGKDEAACYR